jgi:MYXO-CTERM domain-containing protein
MPFTKSFRRLSRLSLTALVLLSAGSALARPEVPGQLQEAADMQCVPLCTMCHATNPGLADNWATGGKTLISSPLLAAITNRTDLKPVYAAWAADPMNRDAAAKIQRGIEPSTNVDVCGPTYGCAVHIAKEAAAPRDFTGPLFALGAVIAGGILRRRRKPNAN